MSDLYVLINLPSNNTADIVIGTTKFTGVPMALAASLCGAASSSALNVHGSRLVFKLTFDDLPDGSWPATLTQGPGPLPPPPGEPGP